MKDLKRTGRPPKFPGEGRRPTLTFRVRVGMHEKLKASATASVRSISEEIEWRVAMSYAWEEAFSHVMAHHFSAQSERQKGRNLKHD